MIPFIVKATSDDFPMECGWGNGYVALPPGHQYHGAYASDIDVLVHGGITFSDQSDSMDFIPEHIPDGYWIIGFDTIHSNDSLTNYPKEEVQSETLCLYIQMLEDKELANLIAKIITIHRTYP